MVKKIKKLNKKTVLLIVLCFFLAVCTVGSVWAYLNSRSETLANTFLPAKVECLVEEKFENGIKSDVKVRNTGNIDSYIRATVIATFVSDDGKVLAVSPKENVDYTVTWANSGWKQGQDGYWYYSDAVSPNNTTSNLIETASANSAPDGFRLSIQIVASAIQVEPDNAVQTAWGITPTNGKIIPD
ncbi:MAG: hypothetical protein J6D52_01040 [Clostridia bacterium]|nr:hypothetical protein [Clostridia bacterium]